jgi:hypothetical protein
MSQKIKQRRDPHMVSIQFQMASNIAGNDEG